MPRTEHLRWFVARVAAALLLSYGAWVFVEPYVLRGMWIAADLLWPPLFFDSERARIDPTPTGWVIRTAWPIAAQAGQAATLAVTSIDQTSLKHMLSGFPMLLALMLATRGRSLAKILMALASMALISWLTITASIWHRLIVMSGTHSEFFTAVQPPPYKLLIEPAPMWQFYLSGYLMYLALLVIPFVAPLILWAALMRRQVRRMVLRLQRRYRPKP